ncbi:MAG: hypothetical protein QOD98_2241, partial [Nocardioidaceae bacterium]|nr:hypothetical protein [Nocardioidaceae bacterium]
PLAEPPSVAATPDAQPAVVTRPARHQHKAKHHGSKHHKPKHHKPKHHKPKHHSSKHHRPTRHHGHEDD